MFTKEERENIISNMLTMDIESEAVKLIKPPVDNENGDIDYDELYDVLDSIDVEIDKDIKDTRKNILLGFAMIEELRTNLVQINSMANETEDEEDANAYNDIFSRFTDTIQETLSSLGEQSAEIEAYIRAKDYINNIRKTL